MEPFQSEYTHSTELGVSNTGRVLAATSQDGSTALLLGGTGLPVSLVSIRYSLQRKE